MTVFKPAARVRGPDGREWEIYAYKIRVGERRSWDGPDDPWAPSPGADVVWIVGGLLWLLLLVPRLLLRAADVAVAALRMARSDRWTIDAVTYEPRETVYTWTTTTEHKGQVLAQVEGHLARGDIPTYLANGVYRGESRSAR
ncbi:MAG TPA: hypothetical protein VGK79_02355 [Gaiellaceae bacterium]